MKRKPILLLALVLLALCLSGCQKADAPVQENTNAAQNISVEAYLADVTAQAADIQKALEAAQTQTEMNEKSKELADLWDAALNTLLTEAQKRLPAADYEKLTAEQSAWEAEKQAGVEFAGKAYEGGSMYALAVNTEAARLTEARVLEVAQKLTEAK